MGRMGRCGALCLRVFAILMAAHEAIIDSAWDTNIRTLLLKRFPDATTEELKEAHGYACCASHSIELRSSA
jgi:hypothetical protein